ncbi:tetratricopeptide repeat protein [Maribacter chungangensis]|uniref:Tetratricopeptide repeat protein n=1 Tax=Maribacter chungangensis TaxID=1069117 RepID=A0ABW3B2H9_9FLAO
MFDRNYFLQIWRLTSTTLVLTMLFTCNTTARARANAIEKISPKQDLLDSVSNYIAKSRNDVISASDRFDYLLKALAYSKNIEEDSLKSKAFSRLSYAFNRQGDSIQFRKVNRIAISLAEKIKDSIVLAEAYWDLGDFFRKFSVPDSAYYSYSQAQKLYESKEDFLLSSRILINMAAQQEAVKDYLGSESTTISAIERLKPLDEFEYLYKCYNQLGIVAKDLGEYDKAIDYYNEALYYANKLNNDSDKEGRIKNNIGVVYTAKQDFLKAAEIFETLLAIDSIKMKNNALYAKILNNLALSKIKLNDTLGSKSLINESVKIRDSLGLQSSLAYSYSTLAEYYLVAKDTAKAVQAAERSKSLAAETSNNERILETLALLTKIDRENASEHGQAYIALNERLQNEERQARNKFARIRFETDEFIAQNEVLSEEKEILSKEKQIWAAVAAGFFLLGLAIYIIVDQRAKNQKLRFQQQQQSNNQEIFNLMLAQKQKVDEVKRLEQKRISEELHDGVLGKMLGARMVLTGLNKKADEEAIGERYEAITALKNIESELRSISHELSHTAYQKINNFANSIDTLLASVENKADMNTIFNYNEDEDWDDLIGDIKINVYRIIQENLQNAIKHSGCSNFFVNFELKDKLFLVTIGDDGKGFVYEKDSKGIGMRNISSRVQKMNGTWTVDTAPNKGTVMKISIPACYSSIPKSDMENEYQRTI